MAKSAKTKKEVVAEAPAPTKTRKKTETIVTVADAGLQAVETYSRFSEFDIYLFK